MIFSRDAQTIIVPVLGTTPAMLVDEVRETQAAGADVIEWRIDMLFGDHRTFLSLRSVRRSSRNYLKPRTCRYC